MNDAANVARIPAAVEKPAEDPLPPLPEFEAEKVFTLSKPIMGVEGTRDVRLTKLTLRAPVGADLFAIGGLATRTNWQPGGLLLEVDTERFQRWLTRLSGQDITVIGQIAARDLKLMYAWLNEELSAVGN